MKIKKGLKISTAEFWPDLTVCGYLDPDAICANKKDSKRVKDAIAVVAEFEKSCEDQIEGFVR